MRCLSRTLFLLFLLFLLLLLPPVLVQYGPRGCRSTRIEIGCSQNCMSLRLTTEAVKISKCHIWRCLRGLKAIYPANWTEVGGKSLRTPTHNRLFASQLRSDMSQHLQIINLRAVMHRFIGYPLESAHAKKGGEGTVTSHSPFSLFPFPSQSVVGASGSGARRFPQGWL